MIEETQCLPFPKEIRVVASRGCQDSDEGKEAKKSESCG